MKNLKKFSLSKDEGDARSYTQLVDIVESMRQDCGHVKCLERLSSIREVNIDDFMKRIKRGANMPIDSLGRYEILNSSFKLQSLK